MATSSRRTWFNSDTDVRHGVNAYASYRLTPSINLSARLNAQSGAPVPGYFEVTDFATLTSHVIDQRNTSRFPWYQRLDLRVNKSYVHARWKATLYAEILNTTNHPNYRLSGLGGNYLDTATVHFSRTAPLIPSVGFSVDF
jgi:hypothetical protein